MPPRGSAAQTRLTSPRSLADKYEAGPRQRSLALADRLPPRAPGACSRDAMHRSKLRTLGWEPPGGVAWGCEATGRWHMAYVDW